MRSGTLSRAVPESTRKAPALFAHHGARRVVEGERTEKLCDFVRANLKPGAIAKAAHLKPGRVYREIERKANLSAEVQAAALAIVAPVDLPKLPEASRLLPRLTPAAGAALREGAALVEVCAVAEADGQITSAEAAEIRSAIDRLVRVLGSIAATSATSAGLCLASQSDPRGGQRR